MLACRLLDPRGVVSDSNNCPVGIATQKQELRARLDVQIGAERLARYFDASVELMQVLARACGHHSLSEFNRLDISTWKRDIADLAGVPFAGVKQRLSLDDIR